MPDNGRTLYSNSLWCQVLKRYGRKKELELALDGLNNLFLPFAAKPKRSQYIQNDQHHRQKELKIIKESVDEVPYYLQWVGYKQASDRLDVYANSLAILFGLAEDKRAVNIIRYLRQKKVSRPYPVRVLTPPIKPKDYDWREFMDREECANQPNQYHNGGVWPYVGAFYAMALSKAKQEKLAWREMEKVAEANKLNNWEFNEWLHGKTGEPMGMAGQSWNAGAWLLAYRYLKGEIKI
jgi:hypothetical protein